MNRMIDLTPYLPPQPSTHRRHFSQVCHAAAALAEIAASFAIVVCLTAAVAVFCSIL